MGLGLEPLSTASLVDLPLFPSNPLLTAWGGFHGADSGAAGRVWVLCQPRCFRVSSTLRNP